MDDYTEELSSEVRSELASAISRTLELDGWDSKDLSQLINALLNSPGAEEFLGDYDGTGKVKDKAFFVDLMIQLLQLAEARYPPENPDDVVVDAVCTDNPSVMQSARPDVKENMKWPKRLWPRLYSCWLHGLSKLLDDIFKLPFFKSLLADHRLVVRKVRKKQWLHSEVYKQQCSKDLRPHFTNSKTGCFQPVTVKRDGETRIGSAYPMFKRNVHLEPASNRVGDHPDFNKKCKISARTVAKAEAGAEAEERSSDEKGQQHSSSVKRQKTYLAVKSLMWDENFFENTRAAITFLRPILQKIKLADAHESQFGEVWESMGELDEHYEFADGYDGCIPADQVKQVHEFVVDRWEYLHHYVYAHSAAYCCNPRHHSKDHMAEESVKTDFMTVIQEFYPDEQDQADCLLEWQAHHSKGAQAWEENCIKTAVVACNVNARL